MQEQPASQERRLMTRIGRWMIRIEDAIYLGIASMLAVAAIGILISIIVEFAVTFGAEEHLTVLQMLDRLLLVLMLVEILHTVGISLREHVLMSESFLTIGLIAAIRRVLVITAEQPQPTAAEAEAFQLVMLELGLLTLLILALVAAIYLLRRQGRRPTEQVEPANRPGTYILRHDDGSHSFLVSEEEQSAEEKRG